MLALTPGHSLHREQVMDTLWPDAEPRVAAANYRQVVHAARRALQHASCGTNTAGVILQVRGGTITLAPPGSLWVDVDAFSEAANVARRSDDPTDFQTALDLWTGELLPANPYDDWLSGRRQGLHETTVWLLGTQAELYERRGEVNFAIDALQRLVEMEPTHEVAHVGLMRLYSLTARPSLATRQFELLRQALKTNLDAEPSMSTRKLHDDILVNESGNEAVAVHTPLRSSLPKPTTRFIGRVAHVTQVQAHVRRERLVTLTGTGGCGKSRLALEVANHLRDDFPDGIAFVELSAVTDPMLIPQAVATTLGMDNGPHQPTAETVANQLKNVRALLIIDNCEHLVHACADFVSTLLSSCSGFHILATSRERLRIQGELTWQVPSLSTPRHTSTVRGEEVLQSEAIQLFVDRARCHRPDFILNDRNAGAIAEICRRIDGLPLAIELAAARINMFAPREIAARLNNALHLLESDERGRPARHRTLRATLDWSHDLLNVRERKLLRRLAIFAGSWSLEAAEQLATDHDIDRADVVNLLSNLADRSLVQTNAADVMTRYSLLDTVRQYAFERLQESGESELMRRRHAEFFADVASAAESSLHGPDQANWFDLFDVEIENIRAALTWARDVQNAGIGLRLCWGAWRFWNTRGLIDEGRAWMGRFLALPYEQSDMSTRVGVLFAAARFAMLQSDDSEASELANECMLAAERIGDSSNLSGALTVLGHIDIRHGELDQARQAYEDALSVRQDAGDQWGIGISLMSLARLAQAAGDFQRATNLYDEARALFLAIGDADNAAFCLYRRGSVALELGHLAEAEQLLQDGLEELRLVENRLHTVECLLYLARAAMERREVDRARQLFAEALKSAHEFRAFNDILLGLEGFALLAALEGEAARALTLAAAADRLRATTGELPIGHGISGLKVALADARQSLDPAEQAAATTRGQLMGLERAVSLALALD